MNAKKSLSSCQLARDLDMTQPFAWYMQQRIRAQMATEQGQILLQGIAEACWKYNQRKNDNAFGAFMQGCFA